MLQSNELYTVKRENIAPLAQLPLRAKIYSAPMVFILINVSKQSQVLEIALS